MSAFHGRARELDILAAELERVKDTGEGAFIVLKGRRRVGKSHLLAEFRRRNSFRGVSFLASKLRMAYELEQFADALARSDAPSAPTASGLSFGSWEGALTSAAAGASRDHPVIIVLDEFPYLVESDTARAVEASINAAWERVLRNMPVMLVLAGSDVSIMRSITEHGRPLFDRPTRTLTIEPLSVADMAAAVGIAGAEAIDAYHVIGGFPRLLSLWRPGLGLGGFLERALSDEDGPFVATGQRIIDGEFPAHVQARTVLSVIGAGERTYGNIARRANVAGTNLRRSLTLLEGDKRVIAVQRPVPGPSTESRYYITDEYLRFWLRFIEPNLGELDRGRHHLVVRGIVRDWQSYLGTAVEPFVRRSLERRAASGDLFGADKVGSYWTRSNDPQVDLVGTDADEDQVTFVGSIKWRGSDLFGPPDLDALRAAAVRHINGVPRATADTPLVAVSRNGVLPSPGLSLGLTADDLFAAW